MNGFRDSPNCFPNRQALLASLAKIIGVDSKTIIAHLRSIANGSQPTFEEQANEPTAIERVCLCCERAIFLSLHDAENIDPEGPWNICFRCFAYATTGDLTIDEESRFPFNLPDDDTIAKFRQFRRDNDINK